MEQDSSIQLITVGPVIDLYGRLAAENLARLMELYPDRVYSKPEFTDLPPYLFNRADFALVPSRDEPFGLVSVEFGRKGALGLGSHLCGFGLMPGWVRTLSRTYNCTLKYFLVVSGRVNPDGSYDVPTDKIYPDGSQVNRQGACTYTSSFCSSTFPGCRVASTYCDAHNIEGVSLKAANGSIKLVETF